MSVFPSAHSEKFAGLTLAFAFEALGDIELPSANQVLADDEVKWMKQVAVVCAEACGETLTHGDVNDQFQLWKEWVLKSGGLKLCVPTIMDATAFLKENGTWTSTAKRELMEALLSLAMADEQVTENEQKLVGMVAVLMDSTQELSALLS